MTAPVSVAPCRRVRDGTPESDGPRPPHFQCSGPEHHCPSVSAALTPNGRFARHGRMRILALTSDPQSMAPLAAETTGVELTISASLGDGLALLRQGDWSLVLLDAPGECTLAL